MSESKKIYLLFFIIMGLCIASKAQTKQEVLDYLIEIGCKEPEIVARQSVQECGHNYESKNARERHNLFGLWNSGKGCYFTFDKWEESCRAYLTSIQYKIIEGEDYYHFLDRIGYATDTAYISKVKS